MSSNKEQKSQKSLFRLIPNHIPRIVSVGRLDIMSEGLMIMTNNPSISSFLENPKNKISRKYLVNVKGEITQNLMDKTKQRLLIDGQFYRKIKLKVIFSKNNFHARD